MVLFWLMMVVFFLADLRIKLKVMGDFVSS